MFSGSRNKIVKYLRNIKTRRISVRLQNKLKPIAQNEPNVIQPCPLGLFSNIPDELLFYIFCHMPLYDLASMALTSRALRDKLMTFHYSTQALSILKPIVNSPKSSSHDERKLTHFNHFHNLGM